MNDIHSFPRGKSLIACRTPLSYSPRHRMCCFFLQLLFSMSATNKTNHRGLFHVCNGLTRIGVIVKYLLQLQSVRFCFQARIRYPCSPTVIVVWWPPPASAPARSRVWDFGHREGAGRSSFKRDLQAFIYWLDMVVIPPCPWNHSRYPGNLFTVELEQCLLFCIFPFLFWRQEKCISRRDKR